MSLHRSSQILRPLCQSCARRPSLLPSSTIPTTTNIIRTPATTRNYTATSNYQAKRPLRSPAAKSLNRTYGKEFSVVEPEEWWAEHDGVKKRFEKNYATIYADNRRAKVFREIGRRLIHAAYNSPATAESLKPIWAGDPARVLDVALAIFSSAPWETHVVRWSVAATSEAGVVWSMIQFVHSQIKKHGTNLPNSREIERIKKIAYEKDDPVALMVWGDVAWRWGRKDEALEIFQYLNKIAYPSFSPAERNNDITYEGHYQAPWKYLVEIHNEAGRYDEADELMKLGALTYRDPAALVSYAYIRKEKGDWESYEQCLVVAAMTGHGEACFRLGNYYYRIYKGEVPSREDIAAKKHPIRTWFVDLFGWFTLTKKDWRRLAINWYEMASALGYMPGTRNLVVLLREDGHESATEILDRIKLDYVMWNSKNIVKLRKSWDDPNFKPDLPAAWLEL
ncbi:conserved hypothetical protein [Talaromyces stipitatus ATCC 10500]|uniref:Uncharacterized protein n=1 Tax=Talaromyces stipitatus (strain ATCC 10500 / CBS 375.48 / QM 6759 / NRRL 1006) TaxID=441959 RepID=B8MLA6_TALSN|nr:uncharacterized protein TSTA_044850 [Talaromyces stipitatus ATCC 10500]EED15021.1 conserved hypothetical protein [Talaromyces stipitatus ATCC 10500]